MRSGLKPFSSQRGWVQALMAALPAITGLVGGMMSDKGASKANAQSNELARENIAQQREFAQKGIRWRVEDAKAAKVHPLYALGATTSQYSPVYSTFENAKAGTGAAIANAGRYAADAIANRPVNMPQGAVVFPLGNGWPHYTDASGKAIPYTPAQADLYFSGLQRRADLELTNATAAAERAQAKIASQPGSPPISSRYPGYDEYNPEKEAEEYRRQVQAMADLGPVTIRWPDGTRSTLPAGTPTEIVEQIYGELAAEAYGTGRMGREAWRDLKDSVIRWRDQLRGDLPSWEALKRSRGR